jgi:hypothetical protein
MYTYQIVVLLRLVIFEINLFFIKESIRILFHSGILTISLDHNKYLQSQKCKSDKLIK